RWSPMDAWLPDGVPSMPADEARAELVRRWLSAFGPATTGDVKWWTGWTVARTRAALAAAGPGPVQLDRTAHRWLRPPHTQRLPVAPPGRGGWRSGGGSPGAPRPRLFDRNGNAGPTVWADGRVVGGWTQRSSGEVVVRLLDDVGRATSDAIDRAAAELQAWVG